MTEAKVRCIIGVEGRPSAMYVEAKASSLNKLRAQGFWILVDPDDDRVADLWSVYDADVWRPKR